MPGKIEHTAYSSTCGMVEPEQRDEKKVITDHLFLIPKQGTNQLDVEIGIRTSVFSHVRTRCPAECVIVNCST